jgi:cytochrome c biogenesis factor
MIPEIGQVTLMGALLVSVLMGILPLIGASNGNQRLMKIGQTGAIAQFFLVAMAFAMLTWAFVVQDFSVEYVARNSNSQLPMEYRFSAVWGSHEGSLLLWELILCLWTFGVAHEGSLLLWELILCLWTFGVALFSRKLPDEFRARTLAVLGWISSGFLMFVIFTSNPFRRLMPSAVDGLDLNPLLQDPGLTSTPQCFTWATSVFPSHSPSRSQRCWDSRSTATGSAGRARGRTSPGPS